MSKFQQGPKKGMNFMDQQNSEQGKDFKLEYYKYILEQIQFLNESTHKYLSIYQALVVAIIGGGIGIFVTWRNLHIDVDTAKAAIQGSLGLLVILDLFITVSIVSNVLSWLDYRKEEIAILDKAVEPGFRKLPTFRNFWRWSETYILFFINVVTSAIFLYVTYQVIPLIK